MSEKKKNINDTNSQETHFQSKLEKNVFLLICFTVAVSLIGAFVEILPLFKKEIAIERIDGMRPYTPLELIGFNIYKREGCYNCHSQQIRYLRDEVERYGHYSLAAESMYDHPFQWGSKRTGPDLARVGERYSDDWHSQHLYHPQSLVPESIMPSYKFLVENNIDDNLLKDQMKTLKKLGVPYSEQDIQNCNEDILIQLQVVTESNKVQDFQERYPGAKIRKFNKKSAEIKEMDAIIAYLQSLGQKVEVNNNFTRQW